MPKHRCEDMLDEVLGGTSFRLYKASWETIEREESYTVQSPFARLLWIKEGDGAVHLFSRTIPLKAEQCVLVPTETAARFEKPAGLSFYWTYFRADYAGCVDLCELLAPSRLTVRIADGEQRFGELIRCFNRDEAAACLRSTADLIDLLARFFEGCRLDAVREKMSRMSRLVGVIRFIDEHLDRSIGIGELAARLHLSEKYFSNLFSSVMGEPPTVYINRRRIVRAKRHLLFSSLPIEAIAGKVGFADPFYFSRLFRRYEGVSPRTYRRQQLSRS